MYSIETALLKVLNNVYKNVDAKVFTVIVTLDIAAFDIICHSKLHDRLQDEFRVEHVEGVMISWMKSYLIGRSQFVKISRQSSNMSHLDSGVPQGSAVGPMLYVVYISPITSR